MVVLGRIVAPFGVKGWLRIMPFGDDPLAWAEMPRWWAAAEAGIPDDQWQELAVRECREHGDGLIVSFEGIEDRGAAETLKGRLVGAPRDKLPEPGEDEYYWHDLIGLRVENLEGEALGKVEGLLSTGAHDVLRVVDGDVERLIPFVAAYAQEVDAEKGLIRVDWHKDW